MLFGLGISHVNAQDTKMQPDQKDKKTSVITEKNSLCVNHNYCKATCNQGKNFTDQNNDGVCDNRITKGCCKKNNSESNCCSDKSNSNCKLNGNGCRHRHGQKK